MWALFAILLLAFGLRVLNINWGIDSSAPKQSYFTDEPPGIEAITHMKPLSLDVEATDWVLIKGSFYYELAATANQAAEVLQIKQAVFGSYDSNLAVQIYSTYLIARTVTILFSLGAIVFTYALAKELTANRYVALFSAFNMAIFPGVILNSILVATDVPAMFFTIAAIYFSVSAIKRSSNKRLLLGFASSGFAIATKYSALFAMIPPALALIVLYYDSFKQKQYRQLLKILFLGGIVSLIAFIIGMPSLFIKFDKFIEGIVIQRNYQFIWDMAFSQNLPAPAFIYYFSNIMLNAIGVGFIILVLISIPYVVIRNYKKSEYRIIFIWAIIYYIAISSSSWLQIRYTMPLMPFFAIIVAYTIFDLWKYITRLGKKKLKVLFLAVVSIIYLYNALFLINFVVALHQPTVHAKFEQYRSEQLTLEGEEPNISFIVHAPDGLSYPSWEIHYPYKLILAKDISSDPQMHIDTEYVLISNYTFGNARRTNNKPFVEFLDRLEDPSQFELVEVFKPDYLIPYVTNEDTFLSEDLTVYFQKFYLYKAI